MGNLSITPAAASTSSEVKASVDDSQNAFLAIVNVMLQNMDIQQDSINLGMAKETLFKSNFDLQNKEVAAAQDKLAQMIDDSASVNSSDTDQVRSDIMAIQGQMSQVQAQEAKLASSRNQMTQEFGKTITPSQFAIQQNSAMIGGAVHSMMLAEKTR